MAFSDNPYAPPGVYTQTKFESPIAGGLSAFMVPVIVGEGSESLVQVDLHMVRGSSTIEDQKIVDEDMTGRAVVSTSATGVITLGSFDGVLDKIRVRQFPITTGKGTGITTTNRTDVSVTINGQPIVVRAVAGTTGVVQLAQAPTATDVVRCTYFFKRTDTLVTDDLSTQVPNTQAQIFGLTGLNDVAVGGTDTLSLYGDTVVNGIVTVPANNQLWLNVDGTEYQLAIAPKSNYTMAQIATAITAFNVGTLKASTYVNQYGLSALLLKTDHSLAVKGASANGVLGLLEGQADNRTVTFYAYNGPIVDGTNGGVQTTDPAHVTVKVNGKQVIPTSLNGATRAVTLAQAPKAGAKVTIQYYFNAWQDTFDYLLNTGVTSVTRCGIAPGSSTYVQEADFVLQNDKILWGTAVTVDNGLTTSGATAFGTTQITATLVDNQMFLAECPANVTQSGGIATETHYDFVLPFQPTLGNGRSTPLGSSLFQTVSNGRIDLPVNRPDVVTAYWGFDIQDALNRGRVNVLKVEGLVITLDAPVPVGAKVFASFYYNTLTDSLYTLTVQNPGVSGTGTYTMTMGDMSPIDVVVPKFDTATKGAGLNGVALEFPSGSELVSDVRYEVPDNTDSFLGPVEETATVRLETRAASPARYTFPGTAPFEFIPSKSDHLAIRAHSVTVPLNAAGGVNLKSPSAVSLQAGSYFAALVSDEIVYEGGSLVGPGVGYDLAAEEFALSIDGVDVPVKTTVKPSATIVDIAAAINEAAAGHGSAVDAGQVANATTLILNPLLTIGTDAVLNDYYKGWKVVIGNAATVVGVRGQASTVTAFDAASSTVTVSPAFPANVTAADPYYIYNPATRAALVAATVFDAPVVIAAGKFDQLSFVYKGSSTTPGVLTATIAPATYASATTLAAAVSAALVTAISAVAAVKGLVIECTATGEGKLQFQLQLAGADSKGYLQFVSGIVAATADFAILAGIDAGPTGVGQGQTALVQGPVAWTKVCTGAAAQQYDRLLIRNRILPGGPSSSVAPDSFVAQGGVTVKSSSVHAGLVTGRSSPAGSSAAVHAATLTGAISFLGGQEPTTKQPLITFYDGSAVPAANNTFSFELDGITVPVTFTDSNAGAGTAYSFGPISDTGSVLGVIVAAMAGLSGQPFGDAAAIAAAKLVRQEGAGFRITSSRTDTLSRVVILAGTAQGLLGFAEGQTASRTLTTVAQTAAALMSDVTPTWANWILDPSSSAANHFGNYAIASTVLDDTGAEYLYIQDLPALQSALGTVSNISVLDTTGGVANALRHTTGLGAVSGEGGVGDPGLNGFYVTSNVAHGSGSANTSMLSGVGVGGQDGIVGQTYRDLVTGLTFTLLPRGWHTDPNGPWVAYPTGATATFRITTSKTFVTNANLPLNAIPGVELIVANTSGAAIGDTGVVQTHMRNGQEPLVGDEYFITYVYEKQDFTTNFYSKMSSVERDFGSTTPDNPLALAAYLAILNGAVVIGLKQVPREAGQNQASLTTYRNAVDELEGVLPGQVQPDLITLLRGDSTALYQYLKRSCELQSSIRYRAERTALLGVTAGTTPAQVQSLAQVLNHTRVRLVYPDMATIDIQDALGNVKEYLVDGPYLAAALAGSVVSPNVDVATPWTGRRLVGFTQLARSLDAVQQNQTAVKGVTVLADQPPYIKVRHGLTTDMTNVLTKLPTIVLIADEIQRQSRAVLENFVGIKFLPGILSQIEGRMSMMLKSMISAQIITAYTGVKANMASDDPTTAEIEAYYSPVFPLLYLVLTFHVRSSL